MLDFSQALSPSKPTFLANLREALVNVGFFYLRNAPISAQSQEQFIEKALGLFELPLEKKLEIEMVNSPHFLGYSRLGAEITALKPDYREQFDVSSGSIFSSSSFFFDISTNTLVSSQPSSLHLVQTSLCIGMWLVLTR